MSQSHTPHDDSSSSLPALFSSMNMSLATTPESITSDPQSHPAVELWNVDVMHIIMSYADRRVVSNLMQTCNALNYAGTKYLIADGLTLRHEYGLQSFLSFLYARGIPGEVFRRLTLLSKITIDFYKPTEDIPHDLESLFEILALAAFNLTSLEIREIEALLFLHPPLGTAIAKLRTLKTIYFHETGVHCATLLRALQSSLVKVDLSLFYHSAPEYQLPSEADLNPILLLEGSQSTLESLSVSTAFTSPVGPSYPNMTHLQLTVNVDYPYIEDYIRAFPNLQSLRALDYTLSQNPPVWQSRRETAMQYQAIYGTWRSLKHYEGSMLALWLWGLTCNIPSVMLTFEQQLGVNPNFISEIILDVRPSDLALRIPGASWLLDDAVRTVLSEEGSLKALEICVLFHLNEADDTVSVQQILDLLVDIVRVSSVSKFKLILDLTYMRVFRGRTERDEKKKLPLMPFEVYLQDMDVDAYADTLLARATSLKEVHVSVVEDRDGGTRQADHRRREPGTTGTNCDQTNASEAS